MSRCIILGCGFCLFVYLFILPSSPPSSSENIWSSSVGREGSIVCLDEGKHSLHGLSLHDPIFILISSICFHQVPVLVGHEIRSFLIQEHLCLILHVLRMFYCKIENDLKTIILTFCFHVYARLQWLTDYLAKAKIEFLFISYVVSSHMLLIISSKSLKLRLFKQK